VSVVRALGHRAGFYSPKARERGKHSTTEEKKCANQDDAKLNEIAARRVEFTKKRRKNTNFLRGN